MQHAHGKLEPVTDYDRGEMSNLVYKVAWDFVLSKPFKTQEEAEQVALQMCAMT